MVAYLKSAMVVSIGTLISRILGMARDIAMASAFGAGVVLDAFLLAFTIPNLFRRLFGEGALSGAFLPVFTATIEQQDRPAAFRLANKMLTLLGLVLGGIVVVGSLVCVGLYYSGWLSDKNRLAMGLLAVMMPYMALICLAAVLGTILNALHHFLMPALCPAVLNVVWLFGIFCLAPLFGNTPHAWAYGMAVAIVIGGVLQVAMQWPPLRRQGLIFQPDCDYQDPGVQKTMANMGPVIIGSLVLQINVLLDRLIAWLLIPNPGSLTVLYMGDRLMEFPLSIIGISLATVVFPIFARHVAKGERDKLAIAIPQALRVTLFLSLPASIGLFVLAFPLIALIYQHQSFTEQAATRTGYVLMAYACSLWIYVMLPIISRAFYALGDTRTPMRIATGCVAVALVFKLALVPFFHEIGLATATSLGAVVNLILLLRLLQKKIPLAWQGIVPFLAKSIAAAATMGLFVWLAAFGPTYPRSLAGRLAQAMIPITIGMTCYFCCTLALRIPEMNYFLRKGKAVEK